MMTSSMETFYSWVNNGDAGDLKCHRIHYNITVMQLYVLKVNIQFRQRLQLILAYWHIYQKEV